MTKWKRKKDGMEKKKREGEEMKKKKWKNEPRQGPSTVRQGTARQGQGHTHTLQLKMAAGKNAGTGRNGNWTPCLGPSTHCAAPARTLEHGSQQLELEW